MKKVREVEVAEVYPTMEELQEKGLSMVDSHRERIKALEMEFEEVCLLGSFEGRDRKEEMDRIQDAISYHYERIEILLIKYDY